MGSHQTFKAWQVTLGCTSLSGDAGALLTARRSTGLEDALRSGVVLAVSCWQRWRPPMYLPFSKAFRADTVLFKMG